MKKLNKKGFTLIELLAVIVILAILVAVAIPAVTRYLNTARKGTYADNAQAAISVVRNHVISQFTAVSTDDYTLDEINDLLEKDLKSSPYGNAYKSDSFIKVIPNGTSYVYYICLHDGIQGIASWEELIDENSVVSIGSCPTKDSITLSKYTTDMETANK